jgi:hypothetical protein
VLKYAFPYGSILVPSTTCLRHAHTHSLPDVGQVLKWNKLGMKVFRPDPLPGCCTDICTCAAVHEISPIFSPPFPAKRHLQDNPALQAQTDDFAAVDTHFDTLQCVSIGSRVMLLDNISPAKKMMNGSTGTVTGLKLNSKGIVLSIDVLFDGSFTPATIRRTQTRSTILGGRLHDKFTFPLSRCYSMTGHKSQGATLKGKVIIHIEEAFASGLVYTILTRVTHRKNLMIIGKITHAMLANDDPWDEDE